MQQGCNHTGINTARQSQQHMIVADILAYMLNGIFDDIGCGPMRVTITDIEYKALQNFFATGGMGDFRVEL